MMFTTRKKKKRATTTTTSPRTIWTYNTHHAHNLWLWRSSPLFSLSFSRTIFSHFYCMKFVLELCCCDCFPLAVNFSFIFMNCIAVPFAGQTPKRNYWTVWHNRPQKIHFFFHSLQPVYYFPSIILELPDLLYIVISSLLICANHVANCDDQYTITLIAIEKNTHLEHIHWNIILKSVFVFALEINTRVSFDYFVFSFFFIWINNSSSAKFQLTIN